MVSVDVKHHVYLLMYLVFTHMPGKSYHKRQLKALLLCLCDVFQLKCVCVDAAQVLWASFFFRFLALIAFAFFFF